MSMKVFKKIFNLSLLKFFVLSEQPIVKIFIINDFFHNCLTIHFRNKKEFLHLELIVVLNQSQNYNV